MHAQDLIRRNATVRYYIVRVAALFFFFFFDWIEEVTNNQYTFSLLTWDK